MSDFNSTISSCFSEASSILQNLRSELNNWNDSKSIPVKEHVDNTRQGFQHICDAAKSVSQLIKAMEESANKVESISRKTVGNGI